MFLRVGILNRMTVGMLSVVSFLILVCRLVRVCCTMFGSEVMGWGLLMFSRMNSGVIRLLTCRWVWVMRWCSAAFLCRCRGRCSGKLMLVSVRWSRLVI